MGGWGTVVTSGSCEVLSWAVSLTFVSLVVPRGEAGISVLATVAVVGVSSIIDCVTATIVITGSRSLRAVVGLEVTVVVEAVVAMLEAVVVAVTTSRAAGVAVTPTAFQMVTAGVSEILGM